MRATRLITDPNGSVCTLEVMYYWLHRCMAPCNINDAAAGDGFPVGILSLAYTHMFDNAAIWLLLMIMQYAGVKPSPEPPVRGLSAGLALPLHKKTYIPSAESKPLTAAVTIVRANFRALF